MFKQIDADGDGAISREEHEAAIVKMADDRRERFNTMDADGDGLVTREEATAARQQRKEGHRPRDRAVD
jgi:Ca2+-binding EF-hand superfamily protein